MKFTGHNLWRHTSPPYTQDYYVDIARSHDNMPRLCGSRLEHPSRMRTDECSNPSRDRPKTGSYMFTAKRLATSYVDNFTATNHWKFTAPYLLQDTQTKSRHVKFIWHMNQAVKVFFLWTFLCEIPVKILIWNSCEFHKKSCFTRIVCVMNPECKTLF